METLEQRNLLAVVPLPAAIKVFETTEQNDSTLFAQPLNLGSIKAGKTPSIDVSGTLATGLRLPGQPRPPIDIDYYRFDLKAGDIFSGAAFGAGESLDLLFPNGRLLAASDAPLVLPTPEIITGTFPADSPLQEQGNAVLANVIPADGTYYLRVAPQLTDGNYTLQLRVHRPFLESEPVGTKQILFLDFDGGIFPASEIIGLQPGTVRVDPVGTVLDRLNPGLPGDEDKLIDKIVELVKADFAALAQTGSNGDFDSTGIPGEFAIDIRNSRDDGEMWGLPNVSRVIVGGTLADVFQPDDSPLLGVAASIDIGNFDTTESAFVLADPQAIFPLLVPTGPSTSALDVLARSFATTISHEAGHFFGALHQDPGNNTISIMDPALGPREIGTGPDLIFGTEDDEIIGFADEDYRPFEVFTRGFEHVTETLAFGLSTGTVGGTISGIVFDDSNADGDRDSGEPPFAGVRVFADLNSNGARDEGEPFAISRADGTFSMAAVPGSYPIRVELPPDTLATAQQSQSVTVTRGGSVSDLSFGITRLLTTATGVKWQDTNGNRTREPNEPGIPNVYVYIDLDNDNRLDITEPQAKTAEDGTYTLQFPSRPGTYTVREVIGAGFIQTFPTAGEHTVVHDGVTAPVNLNFGNRPARDFGDAPLPFPTRVDNNGASHGFLAGLNLGTNIDFENDAVIAGDGTATGDDNDGTALPGGGVVDDEDGIALTKPLNPDNPNDNQLQVTATNTTGRPARLQGWIDFNNDGDWNDSGEQIIRDRIVAGGTQQIDFRVPSAAVRGATLHARFRYGYEIGLGPAGAAGAGEVEDYQFQIQPQAGLAVDDAFEVPRNSVANRLNVLANDFNSQLDPIVDVIPRPTANTAGTVQLDADGRTLLYTPPNGFIGRDSFNYEIITEDGLSETATVTVDVAFQSAVPVAVDDIFEISQNNSDVSLDVLRNDVRSLNGNLTIVSVFVDSGSTVRIAPGGTALRYTPAPGQTGTDQFTYTVADSSGQTSTATVTVNLLPSARADDLVRFDVQAVNDSGQPISVVRAGQQFNLVVTATDLRDVPVNSRGVGSAYLDILYTDGLLSTVPRTPSGSNPLNFQVTFDSTFNVARTGDATIPGLIDEIGASQDASSEFQTRHEVFTLRMLARSPGMAEFKTDPADKAFSDVVLLDPANPELTASQIQFGSTSLRIVPDDGEFAFAVDDIFPNPDFPAAVPVNSPPVALDVLANDEAGALGEIQIVTVDQPANGLATIDRRGTSDPSDDVIRYTPAQNFVGTDQFRYRIVSLDGVTSEAIVTVQVGNHMADDLLEISFDVRQDPADTNSTINVGDTFLLDVFVDDLRDTPTGGAGQDLRGIFAAFFDLIYENDQVQLVNVPQDTSSNDPRSVLGFEVEFGPNYGNRVFSGDDAFPGVIDEFGAVQNGNEPLGGGRQLFATLTLRAVGSGSAVILADPAEARPFSDSLLFEPPDRLEIGEIRYGSVVVAIANGEAEFTNAANPLDVNADGFVSPIDALNVINVLNSQGPRDLSSSLGEGESSSTSTKRLFVDTNADRRLSPIDALVVINYLNSVSRGVAEAEGATSLAAPSVEPTSAPARNAVADAYFDDLSSSESTVGGFDQEAAAAALVQSPESASTNSDDEEDPLVDLLADDLSNIWG